MKESDGPRWNGSKMKFCPAGEGEEEGKEFELVLLVSVQYMFLSENKNEGIKKS